MWMDIKMAGKKQHMAPKWKKLMKLVMHSACKPNETIIEQCTKMFGSRISAGASEKSPGWEKPQAQTVAWSDDMEGHGQKGVDRHCELANNCAKFQVPSWMIISSSRKNSNQLENCRKFALNLSYRSLYLARIGRPDILWSVNKLARSITKWTQACDRRLERLISYIHHTNDFRQYCRVGNTAQHCRLGLFQDSDFAGEVNLRRRVVLETEHLSQSVGRSKKNKQLHRV